MTKTRRNLSLVLVSFAVGMCFFIPYIRFSFYDQTLEVFGINNTQMGLLGSVYGFIAIFGYLVSGFLANKFEAKKLIALSCFVGAAITVWLAQIPSFNVLLVIYALYAVFSIATLWSPYLVIVRNLGNENEQGRLMGISDSMRNLFAAIAGFISIALFTSFVNAKSGYVAMLYASVVLYIIFGILSLVLLPKISETQQQASEEAPQKVSVMQALKVPGVWLMALFIFACYNAIIVQTNYLGTYTTQILGIPANLSSLFSLLRNYIIPIGAGILGGIIVDKSKSKTLSFAVMLATFGVISILVPVMENMTVVAIIVTMFISLLALMLLSTYWSIMSDCNIPVEYTPMATGIISCIAYIPDAYNTIIIGRWLDADPISGFNRMFVWLAVWCLVAAVIALVIHKKFNKNNK